MIAGFGERVEANVGTGVLIPDQGGESPKIWRRSLVIDPDRPKVPGNETEPGMEPLSPPHKGPAQRLNITRII